MSKPLIIGVTGGSGSGKSHFLRHLLHRFDKSEICLVTQDNYYRPGDQQTIDANGVQNFDLPESIDHDKMLEDVLALRDGKEISIVEYTFNNPKAVPLQLVFKPAPVMIIEGILVFHLKEIRELMDLSIFIDATELVKVKRRISRDATERGYDLEDVLYRYEHHVAPYYEEFLRPLKSSVDIIIPNNSGMDRGLEVVVGYIKNHLKP
ncbi:MAG: uridine kinase [Cyclobacteriaceae bacterium]|nr:uridine kinase [Cyclobacteriaceae bacterium]